MPTTGHLEDYIDGLPEEMAPDTANDMLLLRKDSDGSMEKVAPDTLFSGMGSGDVSYADIQVSQLVNEIKGWPPIVKTGDLDALNLWWDKVGTPSTAPSVVAVSGEGITETYEEAIKVVSDGANEGLSQRFTYADEPRIKSGRRLSTLWAIWCVGGVGVTLSLSNQTAEETAATKVTAAAWTIVEVPNHLCAGTYVDIKIISDGAGTIYAVPLGANIGARAFPLSPRPSRFIDGINSTVVNTVDPAGSAGIDVDCTASTSNLCHTIEVSGAYYNSNNATKHLYIRRKGETNWRLILINATTGAYYTGSVNCPVDDGQNITYKTDAGAGDAEEVYLTIQGYWEWG